MNELQSAGNYDASISWGRAQEIIASVRFATATPKSQWGGKSMEDRQEWARDFFLADKDVERIILDAVEKACQCAVSKRYDAMLVLGESGSGKSKLAAEIMRILDEAFGRVDPEKTVKPALIVDVPDPCTPTEFCLQLLEALGDPYPRKRPKGTLRRVTARIMRRCEVRAVLLDNFQDIPAKRAHRGILHMNTAIRQLIDRTKCLWIFLGTEDSVPVIDSDKQLIRRVAYRGQLNYFSILRGKEEQKRFMRVLRKIDAWLPLEFESHLHTAYYAARLFFATEGIFDRLIRLLDQAWRHAVECGREQIWRIDLELGFVRENGSCDEADNPFSKHFTVRRLDRAGEPFQFLKAA